MVSSARSVWAVRALCPRDGGWVRVFHYFRSQQHAWQLVQLMWDMMVMAGDYVTVDVFRTIKFEKKE